MEAEAMSDPGPDDVMDTQPATDSPSDQRIIQPRVKMEITYTSAKTAGRGQGRTPGLYMREVTKREENPNPEQLFVRLNLKEKYQNKMKTSDILQVTKLSVCSEKPSVEEDMAGVFLQRLLMMDYRARYITTEEVSNNTDEAVLCIEDRDDCDEFDYFFFKKSFNFDEGNHKHPIHCMDVQMAVLHCSDSFLKQLIVTKLSQCQYALPLLVPDPFTREIEFPLWTFRQIKKSWKIMDTSGKETGLNDTSGKNTSFTKPIHAAETPMVAFFRLGSVSSSKSQLMNKLINEKHNTFFYRHCPGSSRTRLLMDGVVEIAWYLPSGTTDDLFSDCVTFCNLHGDAEINKEQLEILTEMSSVNVVLLANHEKQEYKEILQKLWKGPKSLICLFSEDDSGVSGTKTGKYRIGLKDRNQSDVTKELRKTIKDCLCKSPSTFSLKQLCKIKVITTDEEAPECQKGKEAAEEIMRFLNEKELYKLKEKHLPCQGKLWHDWCEMNKDLYRLQGDNLEMQKSKKQTEMKRIREQQHNYGLSGLMKKLIYTLICLEENEKSYFLKWLGIFLDNCTTDDLSALHHEYDEKWTKVLALKKKHDKSDKMIHSQTQLEEISEKLKAATFGLEHIFREMGQIYESFRSVQAHKKDYIYEDLSFFPKLAADLIKTGLPLELMDGDAAHVPLVWVSAVLDELIKILGDQRVFVLSVLGIQSSGKSTMLNAMFGLQFAVSAGRCTRGAFMQLVKVSEEMKAELKFDYILVVDTEGLRALELAGKSTRNHDNELATFVIGLGNMTLVNIFGENPAEMQDILQIVVQAFLRMKKVRLRPSCMFVHQNVGDITAGEKNMEGRRRLQEKLDEMTKLAAKEEDSHAECFSDVITFNVQTDVKYFAQLLEGSPPMAPPNPCYSRNVQELKNAIFKKAMKSQAITLSQFKARFSDLWNALLNENFVFSFKNTLEIAVYRKLETEFGKWTWNLRKAMLDVEETLHNRIENEKLEKIEERELYAYMENTRNEVDKSVKQYFEEDSYKDILIHWLAKYENKIKELLENLIKDAQTKLNAVIQQRNARENFKNKKNEYDEKLFNMSKVFALNLKDKKTEEHVLKQEFDDVWDKWVTDLTTDTYSEKTMNFWNDAIQFISNDLAFVYDRQCQEQYKNIDKLGSYSQYMILKKHEELCDEDQYAQESDLNRKKTKDENQKLPNDQSVWNPFTSTLRTVANQQTENLRKAEDNFLNSEDHMQVRDLAISIIQETEEIMKKMKIAKIGYKDSYIQELTDYVQKTVKQHQDVNQRFKFKKEFTVDLCLHVCDLAHVRFTELHKEFRDTNDPRLYLEKQKPRFYGVFKNYCRGATATTIFGELLCSNIESSILQAVYNKTAIDLTTQIRSNMPAFNGNRSSLEKHILKSLAEEINFDKYVQYIHNPQKHFKQFITEKVHQYITENGTVVLKLFKRNLKDKEQIVINAVHIATEDTKMNSGDAHMWVRRFSESLTDQLNLKEIIFVDHKEITDFDFLQKVVTDGLADIMSKQNKHFKSVKDIKMENVRNRPEDILIEHLCRCCWVQCPFCRAICTNTMEDHDGDHSVPLHRAEGINGWYYRGTTNLSTDFCTTNVQSDKVFCAMESNWRVPYKQYRTAGHWFAKWSITPDNSELPYWKWFVCRFQKDLENHYEKTFQGHGQIPDEWRKYTKEDAVGSLDIYI
ncbi:interferon-induced very large GTPase 1-like isoform X2 [Brachyhypopomus gauderio]|uniref:interferon-induced very large GTPase 1-like isoform X2 n=1 Tax=Brachyhypopomus gauderio TaxID=698409 RepID=UPI00404286D1